MNEGPGRRIRVARKRRGLTQRELADGIVSASFLSLVEAGKREASGDVLARLAERLALRPDELTRTDDAECLTGARAALARAEGKLAGGEFADVLEGLPLATLDHLTDEPDLAMEWHYFRGMASESLGRLHAAIAELRQATGIARERGSAAREFAMTIDLIRCLRERGDLSEALDLATGLARRMPAQLQGTSLHARLASTTIGLHVARGDHSTALLVAQRAQQQFASAADPLAKGVVLWNASLAAEASGDAAAALLLADEAAELMAHGVDQRLLGRLQAMIGTLYTRISPPDLVAAQRFFDLALRTLGSRATALDRAALRFEGARVLVLRRDFAAAQQAAEQAIVVLEGARDVMFLAGAHMVAARAAAGLGDIEASREHCRMAQMILASCEPSRTTSVFWTELADDYSALGYLEDALMAYKQALTDAGIHGVGIDTVLEVREPHALR